MAWEFAYSSIDKYLQHAMSQRIVEVSEMSDSEYSQTGFSEYAATFKKLSSPFKISCVYS